MHIIIKGIYLNLDDVLVVGDIKKADGGNYFSVTYKNGKTIDLFFASFYQKDVDTSDGNFYFGTDVFFFNAHKEILNKLTNATQLPPTRQ